MPTSNATSKVVVVSYDAASRLFSVTPNPVVVGPGQHTLYFALQTLNRGDAEVGEFTAISEDHLIQSAAPVDGCKQLWQTVVDNDLRVAVSPQTYQYTVKISYADTEQMHDPSVVLQPPTTGGF